MMSGGFEYNMTTETEFQEMKQKNGELQQQNEALKQSLEQLIKINNELTDSMEQFNNSALKNGSLKPEIEQRNQQLLKQIQYYKQMVYENEDKNRIIQALQGLIDSFNETQKLYEEEISNICEELDQYKNSWESKIQKYEHEYISKLQTVDELINQLRKKQEIVTIVERKMKQSDKHYRANKKFSDLDDNGDDFGKKSTNSEKKLDRLETISEKKYEESATINLMKSSKINNYQKEIQSLRERERQLTSEIYSKDRTIVAYTDLINKLKKKLLEKY